MHWWNGRYQDGTWTDEYCVKCHQRRLLALAVQRGVYRIATDTWQNDELRQVYDDGACPVTDAAYRDHLIAIGQPVPEWVGMAGRA